MQASNLIKNASHVYSNILQYTYASLLPYIYSEKKIYKAQCVYQKIIYSQTGRC